ncbi:MAG: GGDEF domain-containing protein [Alphaproteobacteria bacterium]|nr:GGDEF domain-containing protein [Alphaproteobacteria bacterium]
MDDELGHMSGALDQLMHAISRLEELATRAGREATVDVLTGLPNRRHLFEVGQGWMVDGDPLCAILLDLDDFKWINDELGHHAGDAVLVELARRLRSALRVDDLVCRLAGDEFVVLLPGSTEEVGEQVGDRIRVAVESEPFPIDEDGVALAVSLGIAARTADHEGLDDLLRTADRAMYADKKARYDQRSVRRLRRELASASRG